MKQRTPSVQPCGDRYKGRRCLKSEDHIGEPHVASDGTTWWSEDK